MGEWVLVVAIATLSIVVVMVSPPDRSRVR